MKSSEVRHRIATECDLLRKLKIDQLTKSVTQISRISAPHTGARVTVTSAKNNMIIGVEEAEGHCLVELDKSLLISRCTVSLKDIEIELVTGASEGRVVIYNKVDGSETLFDIVRFSHENVKLVDGGERTEIQYDLDILKEIESEGAIDPEFDEPVELHFIE